MYKFDNLRYSSIAEGAMNIMITNMKTIFIFQMR